MGASVALVSPSYIFEEWILAKWILAKWAFAAIFYSSCLSCSSVSAALVLDDLSDYTNNFDYLASQDKTNQWTDNQGSESSSGSPGWYWQNGVVDFTYEAGAALSPGPFSLGDSGSPSDRAMGSYTGNGNLNSAWGVVFQNQSGQTISQLDISYKGEQWRLAESSLDKLEFSFQSSSSEITNFFVPAASALPTVWTSEASLAFAAPLAPSGAPPYFFDPTQVANEQLVSSTITVHVPDDHFLALRWHDGNVPGNDAALGIDDLTVSFTATAVPEPSAFLFGGLVCGVLLPALRRRDRIT